MKRNKKVIVITGGIASGKSTAVKILKEKGYSVFESDKIVHELYKKGSRVYEEIIEEFGEEYSNNEIIDRKKLSKIVYKDKEKILKLNNIVHKYVVNKLIKNIKEEKAGIIFLDIPLMIEEKNNLRNYDFNYDEIWLIKAEESIRINRLMKRDGRSLHDSKTIISNQMKDEDKEKFTDRIICNNKGIEELKINLEEALDKIKD